MAEEFQKAESLLKGFLANGLELDVAWSDAISFLENTGEHRLLSYIEHYSILNGRGALQFRKGTKFSRLEGDVLFDEELRWHLLNALVFLRILLQTQSHRFLASYLEEHPKETSGGMRKYLEWEEVHTLGLEALERDYFSLFPRVIKEEIAFAYGLSPAVFASYLKAFSLVYALAEKDKKLLDMRLMENLPSPPEGSSIYPRWNHRKTMVGNLILLHDYLAEQVEKHDAAWLEREALASLSRYEVDPRRIGWEKRVGPDSIPETVEMKGFFTNQFPPVDNPDGVYYNFHA